MGSSGGLIWKQMKCRGDSKYINRPGTVLNVHKDTGRMQWYHWKIEATNASHDAELQVGLPNCIQWRQETAQVDYLLPLWVCVLEEKYLAEVSANQCHSVYFMYVPSDTAHKNTTDIGRQGWCGCCLAARFILSIPITYRHGINRKQRKNWILKHRIYLIKDTVTPEITLEKMHRKFENTPSLLYWQFLADYVNWLFSYDFGFADDLLKFIVFVLIF